jgi:hypothetical protein
MGLSRKIRFAAAAASISLVAGPAAIAAPPPSGAAPTAAQMHTSQLLTSADLAAKLTVQRQALAQQTAQRHQSQLQAIKAALASGVQPLAASRLGARSLAPGIAPMGTVVAKSPTIAPPIAIQQLSVSEGDPGTPVLLTGAGFGDTAGEVHFIVASGRDLKATSAYWSNGQIMTEVPYLDGVNVYNGIIYVQHADGRKSVFSSFRFRPPLDVVVVGMPDCQSTGQYCTIVKDSSIDLQAFTLISRDHIWHSTDALGFSGNDEFWKTSILKNDWIVNQCDVQVLPESNSSSTTVTECHPGTNILHTRVHWSIDPSSAWINIKAPSSISTYAPSVTITGPKGLPYF